MQRLENILKFSKNNKPAPVILIYFALGGFSVMVYLLSSCLSYRCGFPLDDAWIHQTYARNLAQSLEWSFLPGQLSSGSTSPLWTVLLAPGQGLGIKPLIWTSILGWIFLAGLAILSYFVIAIVEPGLRPYAFWMGLLLVFEWHMVWAAISGMETILAAFLYFYILLRLMQFNSSWLITGLFIGVSVWVRPDGITLLLPVLICLWMTALSIKSRLLNTALFGIGFLLAVTPYLIFGFVVSGDWFPATFYAKQAEYAELKSISLLFRLGQQASLPLIGVGVLLLPGFLYSIGVSIARYHWWKLAGMTWFIAYMLLFAIRLPVTYQHGRYLMPAMPVFWFWGFIGSVQMFHRLESQQLWVRVLRRSWKLTMMVLLVVFWVLGSSATARDVRFIESEMVETAHWIAMNTPQDALIAAHDIGALGYFSNRVILDLAGLINPEVIPFIRQEDRLRDYLDRREVDYLVTFPGWYPDLTRNLPLVFRNEAGYSPVLGGENMVVFKWTSQFR